MKSNAITTTNRADVLDARCNRQRLQGCNRQRLQGCNRLCACPCHRPCRQCPCQPQPSWPQWPDWPWRQPWQPTPIWC